MAPALAESWSASPDGLVHDFVLRKGVRSVTTSAAWVVPKKYVEKVGEDALRGREAEASVA